jgi:hypothetical protein
MTYNAAGMEAGGRRSGGIADAAAALRARLRSVGGAPRAEEVLARADQVLEP